MEIAKVSLTPTGARLSGPAGAATKDWRPSLDHGFEEVPTPSSSLMTSYISNDAFGTIYKQHFSMIIVTIGATSSGL